MESPEEQVFEADGLARRRSIAVFYATLCAAVSIGWLALIVWIVGGDGMFRTRMTWFGSETLGWLLVAGIALLALYGTAGFALQARRLSSRIRALRTSAAEFARARALK